MICYLIDCIGKHILEYKKKDDAEILEVYC